MKKKYYAVRSGKKTGIFDDWDSCLAQVDGYSHAEYKSFSSYDAAVAYLKKAEEKKDDKDLLGSPKDGEAIAYVDGSYDSVTKDFSYGMVFFTCGKTETFSQRFTDANLAKMRNVAGEIKAAEAAMRYAAQNGIKKLAIVYDYEGIEKWCSGKWRTTKEGTKAYKRAYDALSGQIDISFVKVKGHSGDQYNDLADSLAKQALGLGNGLTKNG